MNAPTTIEAEDFTANAATDLVRAAERFETLADEALLMLSKLRDRMVHDNRNIPACQVDEAMEITLSAVRSVING